MTIQEKLTPDADNALDHVIAKDLRVSLGAAERIKDPAAALSLSVGPDFTEQVLKVWGREAEIALVPGCLPAAYCDDCADRFAASQQRIERRDGVPGDVVGVDQYGKTPADYTRATTETGGEVYRVLGGYEGLIPAVMRNLAAEFAKRGILMRRLNHHGEPSAIARLVRWLANAESNGWLLKPHEDRSQTRGYGDWEISCISRIIAVNFYLRATQGSGQLLVAGWVPGEEDRRERGVEHTGYPYPSADLLHRPHLVLPIATGDIAIVDGEHLHGVIIGDGAVSGRLIANLFIGRIGNTAVVWS